MSGPAQDPRSSAGPPSVRPQATPRLGVVRVAVLCVILVVAVGAGVADHSLHRVPPAAAPPQPISSIAPAFVESSAWYCAGGTSATGSTAATTIDLVNTTGHRVSGTMTAVGDTGTTKTVPVSVGAHDESVQTPGTLAGGGHVATTIDLDGGGVLVTESVAGPLGWSETQCSRSTASQWYFASGSTIDGNTLTLSLFNPTATDAVVDMTFVTPAGVVQPQPFEGIVVAPDTLVTESVDAFVQDDASVSSIVLAQTGAVVAAALETEAAGGVRGLSVRLGVPAVFDAWSLPNSFDNVGGSTSITVFNPTGRTDRVAITVRPGADPKARFSDTVGPRSAWVFDASAQTRIPPGISYLATVSVRSGPGVVVDRTVRAPSSLVGPQFGAATGLSVGPAEAPADTVVLPGPGTVAHPTVPTADVRTLNVVNPGATAVSATVAALVPLSGLVKLDRVRVPAGSAVALGRSVLGSAGRFPLVVSSEHPIVVLEDLGPTAGAGVVSLAGSGAPGG